MAIEGGILTVADVGKLLDRYIEVRRELFDALEIVREDVEDHRGDVWNGDVHEPRWGSRTEEEWEYSYEAWSTVGPHEYGDLVFLYVRGSGGQEFWAVFDKGKVAQR